MEVGCRTMQSFRCTTSVPPVATAIWRCSLSKVFRSVTYWRARRAWLAGPAPADLHRLAVLPEAEYVHEIVRLLIRITRALEHAHLHDIVHRDVKPSNILIERENEERVYLSDFGLAPTSTTSRPRSLLRGWERFHTWAPKNCWVPGWSTRSAAMCLRWV